MRAYVDPVLRGHRYVFPMQLEGAERGLLAQRLSNAKIFAYSFPESQSLSESWYLRFLLGPAGWIEFSSACTKIPGDWHEVGSICVAISGRDEPLRNSTVFVTRSFVPPRGISGVCLACYHDNEVAVESGLCFAMADGGRILVAAGISPGSVSVDGIDHESNWLGERHLNHYSIVELSSNQLSIRS